MTKRNRNSWSTSGNDDIDATDQVFGTNDDNDIVIITDGQEVARFDANNVAAGGPAFDLRPGEAVFLPDFILAQQTLRIITAENAFGSSWTFELNSDTGASIRRFLLSTSDSGTFGSYQFIIGVGAQDNQLLAGGAFDFKITNGTIDQDLIFEINDGGVVTEIMRIAADGADGIPEVNIDSIVKVLQGSIAYPGSPFSMFNIGATVTGVNTGNPVNNTLNASTTWQYTTRPTNVFSSTNGINSSVVSQPVGTGGGAHTTSIRGGLFSGSWNAANSGGTITSVFGGQFQGSIQGNNGTATNVYGGFFQAGGVLGNGSITNASSLIANPPFKFFHTGTITTGITAKFLGGTGATTNWNISAENSAVANRFESTFNSFGHLNLADYTIDTNGFRMRGATPMYFGGVANNDKSFQVHTPAQGIISLTGVDGTNNENLSIDLETTADSIRMYSTTGVNDLHLDFGLQRVIYINSNQWRRGATAPTETTIGTTPQTRVLLFDAINEVAGVYVNFPDDMDKTKDVRFDIDFCLVNAQTNNDVLSLTMDYVIISENSTGSGLDKVSTQVLATKTVTTANGLAINDVYIVQCPLSAGDANNPINGNVTGLSIDVHMTNVTGVIAMHAIDGHLHYTARY